MDEKVKYTYDNKGFLKNVQQIFFYSDDSSELIDFEREYIYNPDNTLKQIVYIEEDKSKVINFYQFEYNKN